MTSRFPVFLPLEVGFTRRVLLAAEIVDGVTLSPVTRGIKVSATGLTRRPIINASGFYVWLEEGDRQAREITVEALQTAYQDARATPLAPPDYRRIELSPTTAYRFSPGATALRGTLRQSLYGPPTPIAGALVRLQWSHDNGWNDEPLASRSAVNGDFAAALRLAPNAEASTRPGGDLAVRLKVERDGVTRTTDEISLRQGAVSTWSQPFIWDELRS
jgi:hypothetical protein